MKRERPAIAEIHERTKMLTTSMIPNKLTNANQNMILLSNLPAKRRMNWRIIIVSFGILLSSAAPILAFTGMQTRIPTTPAASRRSKNKNNQRLFLSPTRRRSPLLALSSTSTLQEEETYVTVREQTPLTFRIQKERDPPRYTSNTVANDDATPSTISQLQVARRKKNVSLDTVDVKRPVELEQTPTSSSAQTSSSSSSPPSSSTTPQQKKSRSSTMETFGAKSNRQRAHDKSLRLIERRTGLMLPKDTAEDRARRRKTHSYNMYKASASVPDSMILFAKEIHNEQRISRREEIDLGQKTQEGMRLQNVYDTFQQRHGREPTDEEWCAASGKINPEAISQAIAEGLEAKNRLVTSNLRMVQSVVNTYIRNGLGASYNAGDLMQEGIMALIRAAEKFEPNRGFKFSTYAMYWVRSSVKRSHVLQSREIPIPQRLFERNKQLLKVQEEIMSETGVRPTAKELGNAIGISEKQVESCFRAIGVQCSSMDQALFNPRRPNNADSETGLGDLIPDEESSNSVEKELMREDLLSSLQKHLNPEQLQLLLLRFGVSDEFELIGPTNGKLITVAELSRRLGVKPWKIRKSIDESLGILQEAGIDEFRIFAQELA